jgi:hypothetical protein
MKLPPGLKIIRGSRYDRYSDFPYKRCQTCAHWQQMGHRTCLKHNFYPPGDILIQHSVGTVWDDGTPQSCKHCLRWVYGKCGDVYLNNPSKGKEKTENGACSERLMKTNPAHATNFYFPREIRNYDRSKGCTMMSGEDLINLIGECKDLSLESC